MEPTLPYASVLPFVVVLLGIALLPLAFAKAWDSHANKAKFAGLIGFPTLVWMISVDPRLVEHASREYVSFIALIGSLYVVSGGIRLRGALPATAGANAALLAVGAIIASLVGTTGASMLLIRPFLRANKGRSGIRHLPVFFIFIVSNAGGLLTPLGDPPLFLGFLRGVPFGWTLGIWREWAVVNGTLIALFYLWDRRALQQSPAPVTESQRIGIEGAHNFLFLGSVVFSTAVLPSGYRELGMIVALGLSLLTTKKAVRAANHFTYHPIIEVGILFAAIFLTMQPALQLLALHGPAMGLATPRHFFWASGVLSSVLDNAPTYLTFFTVAQTVGGPDLVANTGVPALTLAAISLGSVLMGANTYIGNGPNFMVKAIADDAGVETPGFLGYLLWSLPILIPLWIAVSLIFL